MLSRRTLMITAAASGLASGAGLSPSGALARGAGTSLGSQVDPLIGTGGHGHVYPGASLPFGMVQLSPDTDNARWDASSGYYHDDATLLGFSHTHLSGTGVGDMLDLLVVPGIGEARLRPGTLAAPEGGYRTRMDHAAETARPGYYRLVLPESGIGCELTATERTGLHRYTFPAGQDAHLLIDWAHGSQENDARPCKVSDAHLRLIGRDTLVGSRRVTQWAGGRVIHFALKLSRPFVTAQLYSNDQPLADGATRADGAALKCVLDYGRGLDAPLLVKVGLSAVDIDGAMNNLDREAPGFDFDGARAAAAAAWETELSRIRIETPSDTDRRIFYAALYHAQLAPTLFSDADGRYRGMDTMVHQLPAGQRNYSTYSLWDTYRAWHPLMTLIAPDRAAEFARNLVDMGLESPSGPCIWPLQGIETFCMIGWHSAVVIAEALHKRLPGVDAKKAWSLYKDLAFNSPAAGVVAYRAKGYIPCDLEDQSVSKTLEYAYDDWAMARIAAAAGDHASAEALRARSKNYRNLFDAKSHFARPRNADGGWAEPFDPRGMGHNPTVWWDYTECNSWQATFLNQHDVYSYIDLFGGDAAFEAKLDALFNASSELPPDAPPDMSGLIGQYIHGNEPSHHIAYLYAFCGAHHKTQARVRMLLKSQYRAAPDGIAGNEDCGQMSAWYILSALGFYPVDPVSGIYVFGAPLFPRAEIALPGGKMLSIIAEGVDDAHVYIGAVTRNGRPYTKSWISHADLMAGGELRFVMSTTPDTGFGAARAARPPSFTLT
jgi:predicted alpha-1,2-mannosidase